MACKVCCGSAPLGEALCGQEVRFRRSARWEQERSPKRPFGAPAERSTGARVLALNRSARRSARRERSGAPAGAPVRSARRSARRERSGAPVRSVRRSARLKRPQERPGAPVWSARFGAPRSAQAGASVGSAQTGAPFWSARERPGASECAKSSAPVLAPGKVRPASFSALSRSARLAPGKRRAHVSVRQESVRWFLALTEAFGKKRL